MGGGTDQGGGQVEGGDGCGGGDKGGHGYHIIRDGNSGGQSQKASKYDKCLKKGGILLLQLYHKFDENQQEGSK